MIFLVTISSGLIFSQEFDYNTNVSPTPFTINQSQTYYEFNPLHVGDTWQYRFEDMGVPPKYYTTKVIKDSVINGKKYFKKIDWRYEARPPLSIVKYISWERNDTISGASYMLDFEDIDNDGDITEEFPIDSLFLPDGSIYESYKYSFKDELSLVGKKNAVITRSYFWDVYGDSVLVLVRDVNYPEMFINELIADGIGILSMNRESPERQLTGAIINGVKFGVIVSVKDDNPELPQNFKLFQNYPNPFNNSTKITYQIPSLTKVKIEITDILGRTIKIIADDEKPAGVYQVDFRTENLSSGVYFCSLRTGNNFRIIKMIFSK